MSGRSLTLTVGDDGKITITDKGDNRMLFPAITANPTADAPSTGKCLIEHLYDAVGNIVTVTARTDNPLFVASVEDGAGRTTTFVYATQSDGSLKCTAIQTPWQTDPAACTRFAYTDGCLTEIIHEDNRVSSYHYTTRNGYHLLDQAQGADGLAVRYEYSNTGAIYGLPHCITCAETGETAILSTNEATRNSALFAARITYEYGNHLTLVTDNISGKTLRYHFNDNGNEISIDDGLGYAVYTEYDQRDENAIAPINHATTRSRMQRTVRNMLLDPMIEEGSSVWEKSNTGTFIRDQSTSQWGLVSYQVKVPSNGEAYVRQSVKLKPGESYTLSAYLKSGAPTAFLRAAYTINGQTKYFTSDTVSVVANAASADFKRVSVSFTLPADAEETVYCEAVGTTFSGYFWFDCMQLEEGLTCNHFNMLQNSDFTRKSSGSTIPTAWTPGTDDSNYISIQDLSIPDDTDGKLAPEFLRGFKAARVAGQYDRSIMLNQEIQCHGNAGDRFTAGGWCKSFAKKMDEAGYVFCNISVYFCAGGLWSEGGHVRFNYGEDGWQFASGSIVAPSNYTRIRFSLYMNRQMNHADFTGLYLYPEAFGTDYVYDAKGNRKKAIQMFGGVKKTEYDDHDNMIRYTAPGHTLSSTFGYGEGEAEQKKHLLRTSHSPMGTDGQFGYDAHGNAKRADTSGSAGSVTAITRSTAKFQHNANYVHQQIDARGKAVTTAVDANKGITTRVTDPKGQAVEYTHDNLRRVTEVKTVIPGTTENAEYHNEYAYDPARGLLTSVKHNVDNDAAHDVVYHFEYDALGRRTKVLVGDNLLSENVYQNDPAEAHYGTLSRMEYGNGTVVRNVYDDFNRITGVKYDDESSPRYEYAYNANGQAAYVKNNLLQQVAESEYDFSNRPSRVKTHKFNVNADGILSNTEHIYTGELAYDDAFGRLSKFTEKVGDGYTTYATQFGYDDENRPASLDYGDHGESTVEYDGLGRVAKTTVKAGSGTANETVYTYVAGAALETEAPADADDERKEAAENAAGKTSTTGLVETMTQTGGNFTYTYDDNGNITRVVQDGVETAYTYDALGQLIRVDDEQEHATWVYEYDQGGNILSKKKYALGVTTGTPLESKTFAYGNANWKDQLTAVNGVGITYDAIGNPLNDGTWQYEWVNGRQLARMQSVDTDASFVYNENGLRVQKTVNGVVTKYTLHGKNIVHMKTGNDELHFFYDAQNRPAVVVYNGTPYSYVKNLQGDIIAILNSAGTAVVNYVYDAWGRPISCSGTMANTLGKINPFRYRSYVYDEETQLYYLRSRYYKPNWCRFVSADALIQGDLFTYCSNNPINFHDPDGYEQITSKEDLYRLIAEQAVLEGGVPASEFLSRSNEVMNVGLPYFSSMEPRRGFICSGYFLYYLGYKSDLGSSTAFREHSSAFGYIEDIGWEYLPTPLIIGQMVYNKNNEAVEGNAPFKASDITKYKKNKMRVKHTGILRDVYYENGQWMFEVSQFTNEKIGPNGESGGLTLTFTLDQMKDHHWNVWMYPERLREDRCIPIPWLE